MIRLRTVFVSLLVVTVFGLFAQSSLAQTASPSAVPGWNGIDEEVLRAGPPAISIRPVNSPADIPLVQQDIQLFLVRLQNYLDRLFMRV
jgi:hypothetical protein